MIQRCGCFELVFSTSFEINGVATISDHNIIKASTRWYLSNERDCEILPKKRKRKRKKTFANQWKKWKFATSCRKVQGTQRECFPWMGDPIMKGKLCPCGTWSHGMQPKSCVKWWQLLVAKNNIAHFDLLSSSSFMNRVFTNILQSWIMRLPLGKWVFSYITHILLSISSTFINIKSYIFFSNKMG